MLRNSIENSMISIEECGNHLTDKQLNNSQIESLRDTLYALVENVLDEYIKASDTIQPICKKQLFTAESQVNVRK